MEKNEKTQQNFKSQEREVNKMKVFKINDLICFKFHLQLSGNKQREYFAKIIKNGGEVVPVPEENVFTFTTQKLHDKRQEAFDIKFIDDCIEKGQILNLGEYTLDKRKDFGCATSLLYFGEKHCPSIKLLQMMSSVTLTPPSTIYSLVSSPSANSARRIDPIEDNQIPTILRNSELVENVETLRKTRQIQDLDNTQSKKDCSQKTILKNLEKRGVTAEPLGKEKETRKEVDKKREDKRNTCQERSEEIESRINEDKCEDLTVLVKSVLLGKKERERREELERKEQEKKEQERREELKRKEERRKELEKKEQEKKEQQLFMKLERIERERLEELKRIGRERMAELNRIEREKIEKLERIEREKIEKLERIEREKMEKLERIERERMNKIKRMEQECREREKKYQERRHHESRKQEDESTASILKSPETKETNKSPRITQILKVVLKRNESLNSRDLPQESESQEKSVSSEYLTPLESETEEATSGKRGLLSPDYEENLPGCKRSRWENTTEKQILTQNKIRLRSKRHERGDFQSSKEEFSNPQENSAERPFTPDNSYLSQLATMDSSVEMFESDELMNEDEFINQGQLINEKQLESEELDSQISENNQIPPILTQLPMADDYRSKGKRFMTNGSTQNILANLSHAFESMSNKTLKLSDYKIPKNRKKIQEIQDSNQRLKNLSAAKKEPSPLLDDISKALLQDEDSETDFEMSIDKDPTMIRNSDADVEIVKYEKSIDKSLYLNINTETPENIEKSAMVNLKMEMKLSPEKRNKTFESNDDDYDSDAETIEYCEQKICSRPDLIPHSKQKKKRESGLQKTKHSEWSQVFKDSQEQIDSSEDLTKEVTNENKKKENLEEIVPETKKENPTSVWVECFASEC